MKKTFPVALMLLLLVVAGADAVQAQYKGSIELRMIAEQEVEAINAEGEKEVKRVSAARVVPGDEVIYTISYENVGEDAAENVVITNPIPEHMLYKDGSAEGEGTIITFSVDNGATYDMPENLKVLDAEGNELPAKASDYTHIRWTLQGSVSPESVGYVHFRAVLK